MIRRKLLGKMVDYGAKWESWKSFDILMIIRSCTEREQEGTCNKGK
jgi:hypothetical protein